MTRDITKRDRTIATALLEGDSPKGISGPFSEFGTLTLFYNVLKSVNNERFSRYGFSPPEDRMRSILADSKIWLQDLKSYSQVSNRQEFSRMATHRYHCLRIDHAHLLVGIEHFSEEISQAGDQIVFELPQVGYPVESACTFGRVESTSVASNLNAPIGGTVTQVNDKLRDLYVSPNGGTGCTPEVSVLKCRLNILYVSRLATEAVYHSTLLETWGLSMDYMGRETPPSQLWPTEGAVEGR